MAEDTENPLDPIVAAIDRLTLATRENTAALKAASSPVEVGGEHEVNTRDAAKLLGVRRSELDRWREVSAGYGLQVPCRRTGGGQRRQHFRWDKRRLAAWRDQVLAAEGKAA